MFKKKLKFKTIIFSFILTFVFFNEIRGQEFYNYSGIFLNALKANNDYNDDFATEEFKIYKTGLIKEKETNFTLLTFTKYVLENRDTKVYEKEIEFKQFAEYIIKRSANIDRNKIVEVLNNYLQNKNYLELLASLWEIDFWIFDYEYATDFGRFRNINGDYQKKLLIVAKYLKKKSVRDEKLQKFISSISFKDFYKETFFYFSQGIPSQIESLFLVELLDYFEKIGCTELNDAYWDGEIGPSKIPIRHRRRDYLMKAYGVENTYIQINTDSIKTECLTLSNSSIKIDCFKLLNFLNINGNKDFEENSSNEYELYKIGDSLLLKRKVNEWDRESISYFKTLDKMRLSSEELLKFEDYEKSLKESDAEKVNLISKIDKYLNAIYLGNSDKFIDIINEVIEVGVSPILPREGDLEKFISYPNELIKDIYEDKLTEINKVYITPPQDSVLFMSFIGKYNLIDDYVKVDSTNKFLLVLNTFFKKINNLIITHQKDFEKYLTQNHKMLTQNMKAITSNSIMEEVHSNIVNGRPGNLKFSGMIFYSGQFYDRGPSRMNFTSANTISLSGAYIDFISKKRIDVQVTGKIQVVSKFNYKITTPDIGEFKLQLQQDECGEVKLLARGVQRNLWNFVFDVN